MIRLCSNFHVICLGLITFCSENTLADVACLPDQHQLGSVKGSSQYVGGSVFVRVGDNLYVCEGRNSGTDEENGIWCRKHHQVQISSSQSPDWHQIVTVAGMITGLWVSNVQQLSYLATVTNRGLLVYIAEKDEGNLGLKLQSLTRSSTPVAAVSLSTNGIRIDSLELGDNAEAAAVTLPSIAKSTYREPHPSASFNPDSPASFAPMMDQPQIIVDPSVSTESPENISAQPVSAITAPKMAANERHIQLDHLDGQRIGHKTQLTIVPGAKKIHIRQSAVTPYSSPSAPPSRQTVDELHQQQAIKKAGIQYQDFNFMESDDLEQSPTASDLDLARVAKVIRVYPRTFVTDHPPGLARYFDFNDYGEIMTSPQTATAPSTETKSLTAMHPNIILQSPRVQQPSPSPDVFGAISPPPIGAAKQLNDASTLELSPINDTPPEIGAQQVSPNYFPAVAPPSFKESRPPNDLILATWPSVVQAIPDYHMDSSSFSMPGISYESGSQNGEFTPDNYPEVTVMRSHDPTTGQARQLQVNATSPNFDHNGNNQDYNPQDDHRRVIQDGEDIAYEGSAEPLLFQTVVPQLVTARELTESSGTLYFDIAEQAERYRKSDDYSEISPSYNRIVPETHQQSVHMAKQQIVGDEEEEMSPPPLQDHSSAAAQPLSFRPPHEELTQKPKTWNVTELPWPLPRFTSSDKHPTKSFPMSYVEDARQKTIYLDSEDYSEQPGMRVMSLSTPMPAASPAPVSNLDQITSSSVTSAETGLSAVGIPYSAAGDSISGVEASLAGPQPFELDAARRESWALGEKLVVPALILTNPVEVPSPARISYVDGSKQKDTYTSSDDFSEAVVPPAYLPEHIPRAGYLPTPQPGPTDHYLTLPQTPHYPDPSPLETKLNQKSLPATRHTDTDLQDYWDLIIPRTIPEGPSSASIQKNLSSQETIPPLATLSFPENARKAGFRYLNDSMSSYPVHVDDNESYAADSLPVLQLGTSPSIDMAGSTIYEPLSEVHSVLQSRGIAYLDGSVKTNPTDVEDNTEITSPIIQRGLASSLVRVQWQVHQTNSMGPAIKTRKSPGIRYLDDHVDNSIYKNMADDYPENQPDVNPELVAQSVLTTATVLPDFDSDDLNQNAEQARQVRAPVVPLSGTGDQFLGGHGIHSDDFGRSNLDFSEQQPPKNDMNGILDVPLNPLNQIPDTSANDMSTKQQLPTADPVHTMLVMKETDGQHLVIVKQIPDTNGTGVHATILVDETDFDQRLMHHLPLSVMGPRHRTPYYIYGDEQQIRLKDQFPLLAKARSYKSPNVYGIRRDAAHDKLVEDDLSEGRSPTVLNQSVIPPSEVPLTPVFRGEQSVATVPSRVPGINFMDDKLYRQVIDVEEYLDEQMSPTPVPAGIPAPPARPVSITSDVFYAPPTTETSVNQVYIYLPSAPPVQDLLPQDLVPSDPIRFNNSTTDSSAINLPKLGLFYDQNHLVSVNSSTDNREMPTAVTEFNVHENGYPDHVIRQDFHSSIDQPTSPDIILDSLPRYSSHQADQRQSSNSSVSIPNRPSGIRYTDHPENSDTHGGFLPSEDYSEFDGVSPSRPSTRSDSIYVSAVSLDGQLQGEANLPVRTSNIFIPPDSPGIRFSHDSLGLDQLETDDSRNADAFRHPLMAVSRTQPVLSTVPGATAPIMTTTIQGDDDYEEASPAAMPTTTLPLAPTIETVKFAQSLPGARRIEIRPAMSIISDVQSGMLLPVGHHHSDSRTEESPLLREPVLRNTSDPFIPVSEQYHQRRLNRFGQSIATQDVDLSPAVEFRLNRFGQRVPSRTLMEFLPPQILPSPANAPIVPPVYENAPSAYSRPQYRQYYPGYLRNTRLNRFGQLLPQLSTSGPHSVAEPTINRLNIGGHNEWMGRPRNRSTVTDRNPVIHNGPLGPSYLPKLTPLKQPPTENRQSPAKSPSTKPSTILTDSIYPEGTQYERDMIQPIPKENAGIAMSNSVLPSVLVNKDWSESSNATVHSICDSGVGVDDQKITQLLDCAKADLSEVPIAVTANNGSGSYHYEIVQENESSDGEKFTIDRSNGFLYAAARFSSEIDTWDSDAIGPDLVYEIKIRVTDELCDDSDEAFFSIAFRCRQNE